MSDYKHPYKDVDFVIKEIVEFDTFCQNANLDDINSEFASVILTEAAKLGSEVIAPLNSSGDNQGASLVNKQVIQAEGFSEAYQQYMENGWSSLTADEAYGGQNLPNLFGTAINEVWQSANLAFSLCPMLTQGAISAIKHHGSDNLKQTWLPNMISGLWTGTMNLTEPDAGTDLAAIKTKAVANGDHYLISGQKIFITWGDHQMTENVVHLVLARLPDAPAGVKGISLFVVPKFLLDEHGNTTDTLNDLSCTGLEHKLGIHASPTCSMSFGEKNGAVGYIVGEPHKGLSYMFTMMNHARQDVGLQGLAISERSYQQALEYAKERIQGTNKDGSRFSIIKFPDVRRMLMQMKASTEAMRALAYVASNETDKSRYAKTDDDKSKHFSRVELYTPIVKGWLTELAQEVTYLGTQIHGGMGFIEETGSAQHYRDARILTIYEGTTGIQALDLVGRKTLFDQGEQLTKLLADIEHTSEDLTNYPELSSLASSLSSAIEIGQEAKNWLLDNAQTDKSAAGAVSVNFMMMFGYITGAWLMAKAAIKSQQKLNSGEGDSQFYKSKLVTVKFYFDHLLPRIHTNLASIQAGSDSIMSLSDDQF